jgi:hypothetical protein
MDGTTIAISIVCSLLGSGVLATLIAKWFDARASSREEQRADRAADKALERKLRGDRATLQLERRRLQEDTVDALLGHAASLGVLAGRREALFGRTVVGALQSPPKAKDADLGRLLDTDEGMAIVAAYNAYQERFRGFPRAPSTLVFPPSFLEDMRTAVNAVEVAARRWRAM